MKGTDIRVYCVGLKTIKKCPFGYMPIFSSINRGKV